MGSDSCLNSKNKTLDQDELIFPIIDFFNKFSSSDKNSNVSKKIPVLTIQEKETIKMFLWFDMYVYLSKIFDINFMEEEMFNPRLIKMLIQDLIRNNEYTLEGLAYDVRVPYDVIEDIVYGINANPSTSTSVKIICHYVIVKRSDYTEIIRKLYQIIEFSDSYFKFKSF